MIHLCTYFDQNYLHRGLALYQSLVASGEQFTLWVLCFDDVTQRALEALRLPGVRLISQSDFEADDERLATIKSSRSPVEYYWTTTPILPLHVFRRDESVDLVIYLDADTFLFGPPSAIIDELGDGNVLIVPHDYALEFEAHLVNGKYNVGVMAFRRNAVGLSCLRWWSERCIEWCYWRHEDGQIGDQAYLNEFPARFDGVVVSENPGINAAPWNVAKFNILRHHEGYLRVGGRRLVCYHFHRCQVCTASIALVAGFNVALPTSTLSLIYRPYLESLVRAEVLLARSGSNITLPRSGFPWRYVLGRITRRQPVRHFMRMPKNVE